MVRGLPLPTMSVTERVPGATTLWAGSRRIQVRPLGHDPCCAFLVLTGFHHPDTDFPGPNIVEQWLAELRRIGYRRVRTSALASTKTPHLLDMGFAQAQDLVVMSASHSNPPEFRIPRDSRPRKALRFPRRLSKATVADILDLDIAAFGIEWSLDRTLLEDALGATSRTQVFVARHGNRVQGFAVVGATSHTGYLQRLAVGPHDRRGGIASCLVATSLRWASMNHCLHTIVNTESANLPARSLYEKMGFVMTPQRLAVMTKEL